MPLANITFYLIHHGIMQALRQNHKTGPRGDMNLILIHSCELIAKTRKGCVNWVELSLHKKDPRATHIRSVLRTKASGKVRVGVVGGNMGDAVVQSMNGDTLMLGFDKQSLQAAPPAPFPLVLVISLTRPKVFESQLMSAVSMGVKRIFVINTVRTEPTLWHSHHLRDEDIQVLCSRSLGQVYPHLICETNHDQTYQLSSALLSTTDCEPKTMFNTLAKQQRLSPRCQVFSFGGQTAFLGPRHCHARSHQVSGLRHLRRGDAATHLGGYR